MYAKRREERERKRETSFTYMIIDIFILCTRTKLYITRLHALVSIMGIRSKRCGRRVVYIYTYIYVTAKYHVGLLMWDKKDLRSVEWSHRRSTLLTGCSRLYNVAVVSKSVRWTSSQRWTKKLCDGHNRFPWGFREVSSSVSITPRETRNVILFIKRKKVSLARVFRVENTQLFCITSSPRDD